eukprot:c10243_g2_i1.p1 GENE.c10243_g2_i1~~c10243_g2_i1.p1  ORF type:complete len:302 (-),score=52.29 c10243_g2_i1:184-1041(-)
MKCIVIAAVLGLCLGHGTHEQQSQPAHQAAAVENKDELNKQSCYYYSCSSCTAVYGCGWCDYTSTCTTGNQYGSTGSYCPSGSANWKYYGSSCTDSCSTHNSCSSCTGASSCGWCASTSTCSTGSSAGPSSGSCSTGSWSWTSSTCSSSSTCSCSSSVYDTSVCPTGYGKTGDWCTTSYGTDHCCDSLFNCCKVEPWAIALSTITPLAIIAACILACCSLCAGCPIHNAKLRRRQAMAAAYSQNQNRGIPAVQAQAIPSVTAQSTVHYYENTTTTTATTPLVAKC